MTFCRGWEVYGAISTLSTLTGFLTKHKHQNFVLVLRPNPNFRDSSLHRIFNFGIRISGKSESIFQFWDFCESFNKNLAFFNKTWHFRLPNVKIFFHFSTKPRKIFAKSCESLANPGSESWKKDSNQSQIMKRDSNPGSRIRFGLNTTSQISKMCVFISEVLKWLIHSRNCDCDGRGSIFGWQSR